MDIQEAVAGPLHVEGGVHFLQGDHDFGYSDGTQAETYIKSAIARCRDLSSTSRELESLAKDWVSRYHLSRSRSLVFRSLHIDSKSSVLEIGSGCGSITRLLGERAGFVLALEGSPRRAAITRERTRGQDNIAVLCASLEEVAFKYKFDMVICNGVLEYAPMFVSGKDPMGRMLDMMAALVHPDGHLVLAIENKLGLRYFSSGREEHTNVRFDGVEGYPRWPNGPVTFGRAELERLLTSRFRHVEFLFPLPDYKFPVAVVREKLLRRVDCSELFASLGSGRSGAAVQPAMHERLVWRELAKNGLLPEFSNSFVAIAGASPETIMGPAWMGDIYSLNRAPGLEIRTRIAAGPDGTVSTEKNYLGEPELLIDAPAEHRLQGLAWTDGASVHTEIVRLMMRKGPLSLQDRMKLLVPSWWQAVKEYAGQVGGALGGDALDLNWENSIVTSQGIRFIDAEWVLRRPVEPTWLLYRTVSKFIDSEWHYRPRWAPPFSKSSKYQLLCAVSKVVGVRCSPSTMWRAVKLETNFQKFAVGKSRRPWRVFLEDCAPFTLVAAWKNAADLIGRVRGRVVRNFRRLAGM